VVTSNRVKAYGALAGSFLLGALAAGTGYHAYAERRMDDAFGRDKDAFEVRRVRAMSRELDLLPAQEARVLEIFRKHGPERQRILREQLAACGAPMEAHRARIDGEIRAVLNETQRARFETLRAEKRREFLGIPAPSEKAR
jgi:Spy/CpxP family protein refolding chaperone